MKDDFENIEIDNSDDFAEELTEPSVPSSDFNESGTSGIEESGSSFASETNSDVPNVSDADIERLNEELSRTINVLCKLFLYASITKFLPSTINNPSISRYFFSLNFFIDFIFSFCIEEYITITS